MNCHDIQETLELYALGIAEPSDKSEIERHLSAGCTACEEQLQAARATNAMFLSQAESHNPPARLKGRIMASVGVQKSSWGWLGALATAAMMGVALWLGNQERTRTNELADARLLIQQAESQRDRLSLAIAMLNQPETQQVSFGKNLPQPPRGNVFVNPKLGVLLVASNLPKIDVGKTFEMWVIPKGSAPRPAGLFQSTGDGTAVHFLAGPVDPSMLGAVAISVEPVAGSAAPTTTPIVVAAL